MGRVVTGVAALLSLLSAAMLATVWYDDGAAARRGPAVLAPIAEAPNHVPGLGWVRTAAALAVIAAVAAAVALAARRPRPTPTPTPTPRPANEAGALPDPKARPGTPVLPLPDRPARPGAAAGWAALWAAAAATALGLAAWRLGGHATPAVPRTAVLLAGAALTWALAATRWRVAGPAALAVALVAAVAAPLAGPWWAYERLVDRTTTGAAAPAEDASGPARPGAVRWHRPALTSVALGNYVLLRDRQPDRSPRIVVVDAATGAERWSYRHADAYVEPTGDPASGTVVLAVDRDGAEELRAFDLPTGRPLWNRRDAGEIVGSIPRFGEDGMLSPPGVLVLLDQRATRLRALDPRTGAERWRRTVDPECASSAAYFRAGDVLVATSLCRSRTVPAYRLDTGADAWTAALSPVPVRSRGVDRPALLAGGAVVLQVSENERTVLVALDPGTGRERWRRDVRPGVLPATVTGGRVVLAEVDAADRLVAVAVDPATGRPAWTTVLPRQPRRTGSEELVAGTDGTRWYLLAGVLPGGPGTTWLTVLDSAGRPLGVGELAGCPRDCDGGQLLPAESAVLAAAGGTLVVLPSRFGVDREVVGIGDGPAFSGPRTG